MTGAAALLLSVWLGLPDVAPLRSGYPSETRLMRYRLEQARHLGRPARRHWRRVPLRLISRSLIQAVLISEDDRFFEHEGFDWTQLREAVETHIGPKRTRRGGSTITQQLAKNLYLTPRRSIARKLREAAIAWQLERHLTKARILELYLNVIEWGEGVYGAEAAARHYFRLPASTLDVAQAIRLASVLPNPVRFRVAANDSRRMNRKRRIIALRMHRRGWISDEQYRQALAGFRLAG